MISALADAGATLDRDDYLDAARACATFVLETMRGEDGRLLRTYKDDQARLNGYLEDHAFLADGLLALYAATFEPRRLTEARALADAIVEQFWDGERGGFFDTGRDHEALIARPKSVFDNAIPSGTSVAIEVLQRLAALYDEPGYAEKATRTLRGLREPMAQYPIAFGRLLAALDFELATPREIALVGRPAAPDLAALLDVIRNRFQPNTVVALRDPEAPEAALPALLRGRTMLDGRATAYVCQRRACKLPVDAPDALAAQLDE
jgi:uncharacterized protein YyaL (SSP411 family)